MPKPFNPNDTYAKKAHKEGYLARSAYKLKQIAERFSIFKSRDTVLDLGAAPGSWMQVASERVGADGKVVGVDIAPIKFRAKNAVALRGDIFDQTIEESLRRYAPFDLILSDMAPKTSGIKARDQALSEELSERAIVIAENHLKKGGALVFKLFQSSDTRQLVSHLRPKYRSVQTYKPQASRDRSFETYLVCLKKI